MLRAHIIFVQNKNTKSISQNNIAQITLLHRHRSSRYEESSLTAGLEQTQAGR